MDTNVLSEVVTAEREIQRCIEVERAKSHEWTEKVKKESQEEILREQKRIHEDLRIAIEEARNDAESKAAAVMKCALAKAEMLQKLNDETLGRIIEKLLTKIRPE
jgi:serine kinase of HPr protein (carbohydrate metabolism regulator)